MEKNQVDTQTGLCAQWEDRQVLKDHLPGSPEGSSL